MIYEKKDDQTAKIELIFWFAYMIQHPFEVEIVKINCYCFLQMASYINKPTMSQCY